MRIKNLLFTTDFSKAAERALPHALEISRRFESRITILHVRTLFTDDPASPEYLSFDEGKYEASVEGQLSELSDGVQTEDRVDTVVESNVSAAAGILEFADERDVDAIVMGTHGRSALAHFFLGSVAEKVVRHARCPVLTVGSHRRDYRDEPLYGKVLIAFDFSETAKVAVRRGVRFAKAYGAEVEVLYVIEQSILPPFESSWTASVKSEVPEVYASARKTLAGLLGEDDLEEVKLQVQVGDADGKAEKEIVEYARDTDKDLVIMGTHGLSGISLALLGSTTERVVRSAPCPVLTFHRAH